MAMSCNLVLLNWNSISMFYSLVFALFCYLLQIEISLVSLNCGIFHFALRSTKPAVFLEED